MKVKEYVFKPDAVYPIDNVASELGVTRDRLDEEIRNERLNIIRIGHARLVLGQSLLNWLGSSETTGICKPQSHKDQPPASSPVASVRVSAREAACKPSCEPSGVSNE